MKSQVALLLSLVTVASAAYFRAQEKVTDCRVSLTLVDQGTEKPVSGVIRIRSAAGTGGVVEPRGLVSRGWGLGESEPIGEWFVVPSPVTIELPAEKLQVEALAGLETELATAKVDLAGRGAYELKLPLHSFSRLRSQGWCAANTHLHLRSMSRAEADRYLREIPAADLLDLLFISYLERAGDDRDYITNQYPIGRLPAIESAGVVVANGEEHRHNFGPQGEGYGHVMLLGIRELVRPVSIGYGISKKHPDAPPICSGIDQAHAQGGTAIWCHNNWGYEDVSNWIAGKLDAQNIFDGGSHGGYAESFYHYLNAGLHVPFSTGTDWFLYDFARAYARVDGALTPETWLAALRAGRTFITNGPLLEFRVNGSEPGDSMALEKPAELVVESSARGRVDFGRLELIQNARVVALDLARPSAGHYEARLRTTLAVTEPCWLAVRVTATAQTEYGQPIFAHSSPVYVIIGGRSVQIAEDIEFLMRELETARSEIAAKAQFDNSPERDRVFSLYEQAMDALRSKQTR